MSNVSTKLSDDGKELTIFVIGRFTYDVHKGFRNAYNRVDMTNTGFIIDLRSTEYMDSAALGMLLLLRERAGGDQADIKITNCSPELEHLIKLTNFHNLFKID